MGKKSSVLHSTEKFYEKLRDSRDNPKQMVNSPLLIADNVGDVLGEAVRIKDINKFLFEKYFLAGCFG